MALPGKDMQNEIQFDFTKAQNLITVLEDCKKRLAAAAKEINSAAPSPDWWFDEAMWAYKDRFRELLPNINEYELVVNDALNYLKKVSAAKSDFEKKAKNRFK